MDNCARNRTNQRTIQKYKIPWNRNSMHPGQLTQRKYTFNSKWPQIVKRMPVRNILPGTESYWCETCDKGFMTRILLNNHIQRHQKCNIDGCEFVAHPLVITKHIQMQHATGLYKRIGKLNNPEEIKKWRDERKKKYPTRENIERKKAVISEKINRGEKMGLQSDTQGFKGASERFNNGAVQFSKGRQTFQSNTYIKRFGDRKTQPTQIPTKKRPIKRINKVGPPKEEARKLQPFAGIQGLIVEDTLEEEQQEKCHELFEDEEDNISEKEQNIEDEKPTVCGALSSLMCTYVSSDDELEEDSKTNSKYSRTIQLANEIAKMEKTADNGNKVIVKNINGSNDSENESGPEEAAINKDGPVINDQRPVKITRKDRLQKLALAKNRSKTVNLKRKLPSTLLEKLLHREIQHERNVILQCVRYVVQNNYFDK